MVCEISELTWYPWWMKSSLDGGLAADPLLDLDQGRI